MLPFLMLLALTTQDFPYEIDRAKAAMATYGPYQISNERVHVRSGSKGSEIATYCATVRYKRQDTGKWEQHGFYWVLRVKPAAGRSTDYERGQWQGAGDVDFAEYAKLCTASKAIDDGSLLTSNLLKSSGSLYDPQADMSNKASAEWLAGSWVYAENCATSRDEFFHANGEYSGGTGSGSWAMVNGKLTITFATEVVEDDSDYGSSEQPLKKLRRYTALLKRTGIDSATINGQAMIRC